VARAALACLAAALLAGCGNPRTRPPETVVPEAPLGARQVRLDGIRFTAPVNWPDLPAQGDRLGGIRSRTATLAVWRYPRTEPLPSTRAALEQVRGLLEGQVRRRDPGFRLRSSRLLRDGIELVGRQTIAGLPFDVRSRHLFRHGAEVVVDAYARPADFARVDATVFEPLLRSLRLP
jgi:hypothetical protein